MMKDRLPPYSEEAEQATLGCLMLDAQMCVPVAQARINSESFFDVRHANIYKAIIDTFESNGHVDPIVLQRRLKQKNQLEAIGGMQYLSGLMNIPPAAAAMEHYLEIVVETATLRKILNLCATTTQKIYEAGAKCGEALNDLQRAVMEIDPATGKSEDIAMSDLMIKVHQRIESYTDAQSEARGMLTGFTELDGLFNGMKPTQLIILAARPSIGKSSLALNIAENIAENGEPCGVFTMEMEAVELGERSVSSGASIDGQTIQSGSYDLGQAQMIAKTISQRRKLPIYFCEQGGMTFPYFRARLRRMVQRNKIKLAVVDYLQLFQTPGRENRSIEIGAITTGLKALAKELRIVIICLSQLNRDLEKDNRRPRMSDLRDSGSIEQDADKILLLSEEQKTEAAPKKKGEKVFTPPAEDADPDCVTIVGDIPKNRGGKRGVVRFRFRRQFTRFENIPKITDADLADWPPK